MWLKIYKGLVPSLSYEVRSTNIAKICRTQIIYSSFWDMRHYTPAACCYVMRTYEIRL